jgi:chromosome segregation ATPase
MNMSELEQRIADLKAQKEAMEGQENFDVNEYNKVLNDISEAEYQLSQQQEKEQREQQQQTVINNAVDMLPTIFEALFPADKFQQIFGLNLYAEKQQQFYQLSRANTAQQLQETSQAYEATIAQKDDKIKLLNKQALEVQQQLDTANKASKEEKDAHDRTAAELAETRKQLTASQAESASKDETIAELKSKLNATQQPKAEPSSNLQDMITQVKSTSAMSANDLVSRWLARQTSDEVKAVVPEVPSAAPATFPDTSTTSQTDHNGDTEASSAEVQPPSLTEETFPVAPGLEMADEQQGVQPAGADVSAEIERIKARLDRLEKQANLPALEVA